MTGVVEQPASTQRRLLPLLAATAVSVTGDGAFIAAAPLLAATLTREPWAVSTVTAAFYLPWLVLGLPAGALADRWPKRRTMITADLVRAVTLAILTVLVVTSSVTLPVLVAAVLVVGVGQCFFDSSAQASIPQVIGREKESLARFNGRFWSLDTVGRSLLGPPLGSSTFALKAALPFAVDALSFVASAVLVRRLPHVPAAVAKRQGIWTAVQEGLAHLFKVADLRALALAMGVYNFAYNLPAAVLVLYATQVLHLPVAAYGLLLACAAVGGTLAGWQAEKLTRHLSYRQATAIAHGVQAVAWAVTAVSGNAAVTAVMLALLGGGSAITSVATGSARQALTPDALLGRVVSAYRLFGLGAAGLGALLGGAVASVYGLTAPLVVASALLVVSGLATWPWRRSISR